MKFYHISLFLAGLSFVAAIASLIKGNYGIATINLLAFGFNALAYYINPNRPKNP